MQTVPRTAQLGDLNGNEAKSREKKIDPTRFHVMLVVYKTLSNFLQRQRLFL